MTYSQQFQQHPSSVDIYIREGWKLVPIPPGTKGPVGSSAAGWNRPENVLTSANDLPNGWGIGLAHAYSGTMAVDVDHWERAAQELFKHNINLNELYTAKDAVIINSNRPGHGKLLYKMPKGLVLPSKKLTDKDHNNQRYNYLDFRCGTSNGLTVQDVLPPTIHPETGRPYSWAGYGSWQNLPEIPAPLLKVWQDMVDGEKDLNISSGDGLKTSWEEIKSALSHISPDISRHEWLHVGMALNWAGYQSGELGMALALFDEWSQGSVEKYKGKQDIVTQWKSFRNDRKNAVRLGTLFQYAIDAGWTRPKIDASYLFSKVDQPVKDADSLLFELRPPPPEVNLDLFPKILATRANEISESVGCDPLVPLWAGLAAVCGVVDTQSRLELMPGFKVPPILWLMTIGNPADKKSPGSRPMLSPLKSIELEDRPRYQKELLQWEAQEAAYASAKKAFLDFSASAEAMLSGEEAPHVPELPRAPVPVKITVGDITSQKLVRQVCDRPRGVMCYLDEMNAWVRKMVDKNSGDDRSAWVVSYEGEPYEMDRVGAGSIHADNMAVSIFGNMQPRIYRENVTNLSADGLIQRFLPVVLRSGQTRLGNPLPEFLTSAGAWESTLRLIFSLPAQRYTLSPEAYQEFREFQKWYENAKRDERLLSSPDEYMTAFGKLEGTTGRLALIFHIIDNPFTTVVSKETMSKVIELVKTFVIPSLRYTLSETAGVSSFDKFMTEWLIQRTGETSFTLQDIRNTAKSQLKDMHPQQINYTIVTAMYTFEKCGWVMRVDDGTRELFGVAQWVINPAIHDAFRDHREKIVKAKARRYENLKHSIKGLNEFMGDR